MDNSGTILLSDSRHPVIERIQAGFVPNDIGVKKGELCIITGPKYYRKSTVMRQLALNVLMAQMDALLRARPLK